MIGSGLNSLGQQRLCFFADVKKGSAKEVACERPFDGGVGVHDAEKNGEMPGLLFSYP